MTNAVTDNANFTVAGSTALTFSGPLSLVGNRTITNSDSSGATFSSISGTNTSLTIAGSVNTTISALSLGSGSLVKNGSGTLTVSGSNAFSGGTALNAGTLVGTPGALGTTPFGAGAVTLNGGTLKFTGSSSGSDSITSLIVNGNNTLAIGSSSNTTTLSITAAANPILRTPGGTLIVTPYNGPLNGSNEVITFTNSAPPVLNGIISPFIVTQANGKTPTTTADFVTAAAGNLAPYAAYTALPQSGSSASVVYNATASTALTASESVYALKVGAGAFTVSGSTFTLTISGGLGQSGLLLNGGGDNLTVTTLAFGNQEG